MAALVLLLFRLLRLLGSGHEAIAVENAALRLQLMAYQRKRARPKLTASLLVCVVQSVASVENRSVCSAAGHGRAVATRALP